MEHKSGRHTAREVEYLLQCIGRRKGGGWIATHLEILDAPDGSICRVDKDGSIPRCCEWLALPNGLAFSPERLEKRPQSGDLFRVETDVQGRLEPVFEG